MKKIISIVFVLAIMVSIQTINANTISDGTLGTPIINIDDTVMIGRYPATLQKFSDNIFVIYDNAAASDYSQFGITYRLSDVLGLKVTYENTPTVTAYNYVTNGATALTVNLVPVSTLTYGLKLGDFFAGFAAKTYFLNAVTFKSVSYTNKDAYVWTGVSGFKTTFTPSAAMEIAGLNVYAAINSTIDLSKAYGKMNYATNTGTTYYDAYAKGALFPNAAVSVLAAKNLSEMITLGLEIKAGTTNIGYSFQTVTNGADTFATNTYQGGSVFASVGLGSRIKANDKVTLFFDMLTAIHKATPLHKKDAATTYTTTTRWLVPSFTMGAEFEIVKNLKFRISAKPTYSITYTGKPVDQNGLYTVNSTSTAFDVASAIGLGYKLGSFSFTWELAGTILNTIIRDPQQFLTVDGVNVNNPLSTTKVQVTYNF